MDITLKAIEEKHLAILHSMLFLLERAGGHLNRHKLLKMLYFADQKHLKAYGSSITSDHYVAMKYGPVPSRAYGFIQTLDGDEYTKDYRAFISQFLQLENKNGVKALKTYDREELSDSAVKYLSESYDENRAIGFKELTEKSHDYAWQKSGENDDMDLVQVAKAVGASDDMLDYIKESQMLEKAKWSAVEP